MSNQNDGFNSNTHQFAVAISGYFTPEDISSARDNPSVHAPRILHVLRQKMPKDEQNKFRAMFCGCSPRSKASEKVLLSAVRESINLLSRQDETGAIK
ncbi:MAG: hypothetical protein L0H38_02890 [bacterium]|nr:hypothetical protein [bacterium]